MSENWKQGVSRVMDKPKVGFIGLGTMGRPMAANILAAGYYLVVHSRTRAKAESLLDQGANWADSPAEVASRSEVVITMLPDSPDVWSVATGEKGILQGASQGLVFVDMSTISPDTARRLASQCEQVGVEFLDAPVTGGEVGAVNATLSVMVGGPVETLAKVRPILECLGKQITHMGGHGAGQTAKLCNQIICALNILACCEGLSLAASTGLDLKKLLGAIQNGAAGSWMLSNLAPKMLESDWSPGFRIALQAKDLRLALESAERENVPLAGTALTHQLFKAAQAMGFGDEGTQALFKTIRLLSGSASNSI
ncbi:MAG: NAD(P)-dependent oxidoreductase [Armatimonadota bacterium]|nr:NAD(P)-dependent oxidoreductase [Armatimonadota bacterium]